MNDSLSRRDFTKLGAAAAVGLAATKQSEAAMANDVINVGVIGVGNRGTQVMDGFVAHKDCKIVAVTDVYKPFLDRAKEKYGQHIETYEDYRKMLERKDLDAILIATPDHWHAIQMIDSVNSGRDVYVEKPLATTIVEGRKMVEAAERTKKIVQVGLHRRSMQIYHKLREYMKTEEVGKITVSRAYRLSNMAPNGIGRAQTTPAPGDLNWDKWLGPRPYQKYQDNITPYKFRWWQGYSSQMGNWGVHYFDAIRWMLGATHPTSINCMGGVYAVDDDRTIPDTAEAVFELNTGGLLVFGTYEASSHSAIDHDGELEFRGTQGTVFSSQKGYKVVPEKGGQFQSRESRMKSKEVKLVEKNAVATAAHVRNFLDCIKTREQPNAPVEEGHRSTLFCHLANISLATKSRLEWDAENEKIINNSQANELLHYEYRAPYKLS